MGAVPVFLYEAKQMPPNLMDAWQEQQWLLATGYGFQVVSNVGLAGVSLFSAYSGLKAAMLAVSEYSAYNRVVIGALVQNATPQLMIRRSFTVLFHNNLSDKSLSISRIGYNEN